MMIRGIAERDEKGGFLVFVDGKKLSPERSQKLRNHSPDGFNWSYSGSGPAQLALGLLLEFTDDITALRLYQRFKWEVIASLPKGNFELENNKVIEWINKNRLKTI